MSDPISPSRLHVVDSASESPGPSVALALPVSSETDEQSLRLHELVLSLRKTLPALDHLSLPTLVAPPSSLSLSVPVTATKDQGDDTRSPVSLHLSSPPPPSPLCSPPPPRSSPRRRPVSAYRMSTQRTRETRRPKTADTSVVSCLEPDVVEGKKNASPRSPDRGDDSRFRVDTFPSFDASPKNSMRSPCSISRPSTASKTLDVRKREIGSRRVQRPKSAQSTLHHSPMFLFRCAENSPLASIVRSWESCSIARMASSISSRVCSRVSGCERDFVSKTNLESPRVTSPSPDSPRPCSLGAPSPQLTPRLRVQKTSEDNQNRKYLHQCILVALVKSMQGQTLESVLEFLNSIGQENPALKIKVSDVEKVIRDLQLDSNMFSRQLSELCSRIQELSENQNLISDKISELKLEETFANDSLIEAYKNQYQRIELDKLEFQSKISEIQDQESKISHLLHYAEGLHLKLYESENNSDLFDSSHFSKSANHSMNNEIDHAGTEFLFCSSRDHLPEISGYQEHAGGRLTRNKKSTSRIKEMNNTVRGLTSCTADILLSHDQRALRRKIPAPPSLIHSREKTEIGKKTRNALSRKRDRPNKNLCSTGVLETNSRAGFSQLIHSICGHSSRANTESSVLCQQVAHLMGIPSMKLLDDTLRSSEFSSSSLISSKRTQRGKKKTHAVAKVEAGTLSSSSENVVHLSMDHLRLEH